MTVFTQQSVYQIELRDFSVNVGIKRIDRTFKDRVELEPSIHRRMVNPNSDISNLPQKKQDIINFHYAAESELVASWRAEQAEIAAKAEEERLVQVAEEESRLAQELADKKAIQDEAFAAALKVMKAEAEA